MCARPSGCYRAMCARDLRGYRAAPISLSSRYKYCALRDRQRTVDADLDSAHAELRAHQHGPTEPHPRFLREVRQRVAELKEAVEDIRVDLFALNDPLDAAKS